MKFLDEQIKLNFTGLSIPANGTYRYVLLVNYSIIFTGNVYIASGATTLSIQVGDILRNYKDSSELMDLPFSNSHITVLKNGHTPIFNVSSYLYVGDYDTYVSNEQKVIMSYRYPHRMAKMELPFIDQSQTSDKICNLMQGGANNDNKKESDFLPHYPYIYTTEYGFAGMFQTSNTNYIFYIPVTLVGTLVGSSTFDYSTSWFGESKTLYNLYTALNPSVYTTDNSDLTAGGNLSWDATLGAYTSTNASQHNRIQSFDLEWGDGGGCIYRIDVILDYHQYIFNRTVTVPVYLDSLASVNLLKSEGLTIYAMSSTGTDGSVNISFSDLPGDVNNWVGKTIYVTYTVSNNSLAAIGGIYGIKDISASTASPDSDAEEDVTMFIDTMPVAKIDTCPAKYYLMWQDRGGSFQSQPFEGKVVYSEDIKRETLENYLHEKRDYNIQVTPKWKINTKWIPQENYPYYESIFVSPKLVLYDTQEDVSYNVLVKGNYTEKKFKNEKKLINLELDLEENKTQNIIY